MLQQLLTSVPYYDISSQEFMDTDARNISAEVRTLVLQNLGRSG